MYIVANAVVVEAGSSVTCSRVVHSISKIIDISWLINEKKVLHLTISVQNLFIMYKKLLSLKNVVELTKHIRAGRLLLILD